MVEDQDIIVTEQPPAPAPVRSQAWIGRAAFEAGLIVLGLVGALLVDEWRDGRDRRERVTTALASIRTELEANREALRQLIARNEEIMAALGESAATGREYGKGLVGNFPASSVAWSATLDAGTTSDVEHDLLMILGRAYDAVKKLSDERQLFLNYLYTYDSDRSLRANPVRLQGWLSDMTSHARDAEQQVVNALNALRARRGSAR